MRIVSLMSIGYLILFCPPSYAKLNYGEGTYGQKLESVFEQVFSDLSQETALAEAVVTYLKQSPVIHNVALTDAESLQQYCGGSSSCFYKQPVRSHDQAFAFRYFIMFDQNFFGQSQNKSVFNTIVYQEFLHAAQYDFYEHLRLQDMDPSRQDLLIETEGELIVYMDHAGYSDLLDQAYKVNTQQVQTMRNLEDDIERLYAQLTGDQAKKILSYQSTLSEYGVSKGLIDSVRQVMIDIHGRKYKNNPHQFALQDFLFLQKIVNEYFFRRFMYILVDNEKKIVSNAFLEHIDERPAKDELFWENIVKKDLMGMYFVWGPDGDGETASQRSPLGHQSQWRKLIFMPSNQ